MSTNEIIMTVAGLLLLCAAVLGVAYIYLFEFPKLLEALANQNRLITKRKENHWMPIIRGGAFAYGIVQKRGYILARCREPRG